MKLVLQITLGVFLGTLASQLTLDTWRAHQESMAKAASEKLQAAQEKVRLEQNERIRTLFMKGRQGNTSGTGIPPSGFVPDDAEMETIKQE